LMMLDGWTWEGMTLKADSSMFVSWPRFGRPRTRGPREEGSTPEPESDRLAPLHELVRETKAYMQARKTVPSDQPIDLRSEAMVPVLSGQIPMMIQANTIKQIQTAIAFTKQHGIKMILVGAADASHCLNLIQEAKVPVIVSSTYRLPARHDSPYDEAYALPSVLQKAGITYCIASDGRFGASGVRNLPYHAASASAFGLTEDQAIRAITLSSAEIMGVNDRVGSLEVGKDATLILADGNILETPTQVVKAYIQGRAVDLTSKHTQLYEKYQAKYKQ
jgi:imidazolonepropionase-like amidohydrolase